MAVHPPVRDEAEKMKPVLARRGECFLRDAIMRELAVRNRFVNPSEILINDSAGAEIQMTDFRIAHLSVGQTDIGSARAQFAARITAIELVVERCARKQGGV